MSSLKPARYLPLQPEHMRRATFINITSTATDRNNCECAPASIFIVRSLWVLLVQSSQAAENRSDHTLSREPTVVNQNKSIPCAWVLKPLKKSQHFVSSFFFSFLTKCKKPIVSLLVSIFSRPDKWVHSQLLDDGDSVIYLERECSTKKETSGVKTQKTQCSVQSVQKNVFF